MIEPIEVIKPTEIIDGIRFFNCDSELYVKQCADHHYDMSFCDPPYGIGMSKSAGKSKKTRDKKWDENAMSPDFFKEHKRISTDQIIWGANHFIDNLPKPRSSSCWLLWDKREGFIPERTYADAEIAWTSFTSPIRVFRFYWDGFLMRQKEVRIHPTQKPVSLYEWKLMKFCKEGDTIVDLFGGSFSSAIACHNLGFKLDIVEKDEDTFKLGLDRFKEHIKQENIWKQAKQSQEAKQEKLF